jgi:hypothetical protein
MSSNRMTDLQSLDAPADVKSNGGGKLSTCVGAVTRNGFVKSGWRSAFYLESLLSLSDRFC